MKCGYVLLRTWCSHSKLLYVRHTELCAAPSGVCCMDRPKEEDARTGICTEQCYSENGADSTCGRESMSNRGPWERQMRRT